MTEYKEGVKIIRQEFWIDVKYSLFQHPGSMKYEVNTPIKRPEKGGPLAVFKTLKDALSFMSNRFGISWQNDWQCSKIKFFDCLYEKSKDKNFWYDGVYFDVSLIPCGTVFADELILKEEIIDF